MSTNLRTAAQQALEALEERYVGALRDKAMDALRAALEQPEQATGKESLPVGQEEPEGGWQSAPSPQVTQRIADMPMSEYRRGVNDGFKLGLREGRIKAEDEMREKPEQEPVLTINKLGSLMECSPTIAAFALPDGEFTLYTHPPRREWRGLTEEEIRVLVRQTLRLVEANGGEEDVEFYRAIEAALKERNV